MYLNLEILPKYDHVAVGVTILQFFLHDIINHLGGYIHIYIYIHT